MSVPQSHFITSFLFPYVCYVIFLTFVSNVCPLAMKSSEGNTASQYYIFIMFSFAIRYIMDWTYVEFISDFVAGVQMTTNASSSLCHSILMTYPTTGRSVWTCWKDSSLEKLDKSWSVPWQSLLVKFFFIIVFFICLLNRTTNFIKKKIDNLCTTNTLCRQTHTGWSLPGTLYI